MKPDRIRVGVVGCGDVVHRHYLPALASGARHFIACLLGTETPILTAEHARHVLDVILQAYASIADGRAHEVETSFARSEATA